MVMKSLRDGASDGYLKYILLGFLLLAGGGLVFTDMGGFFRDGVTGSSNVAKVGDRTISLPEFDRDVRIIASRMRTDPQTAYRNGMMREIMSQKIQESILEQAVYDLGISISDEYAAQTIKKDLQPIVDTGQNPADALQMILRSQNMSEQGLMQARKREIANNLFINTLQSNAVVSDALVENMAKLSSETRNFSYVILNNTDVKIDKDIVDEDLRVLYETEKERFSNPEKRSYSTLALQISEDEGVDEDMVLEEKYALADQVDDYAAGGMTLDEIGKELNLPVTQKDAVSLLDAAKEDIDISQALFDMEYDGEVSPLIEKKNGEFVFIGLNTIQEKTYKPFEEVRTELVSIVEEREKRMAAKEQALVDVSDINNGKKTLASLGAVKTREKFGREDKMPEPFLSDSAQVVFATEPGKAILIPIIDGQAIVQVTKSNLPEKVEEEKLQEARDLLKQQIARENLVLYLQDKRKGMKIMTNDRLLERAYGASGQIQ